LRSLQARTSFHLRKRAVVIRTQLQRAGEWALIKQQFIGVSGQVCSVTYELTGPAPAHFNDLAEATAAFWQAEGVKTGELA
jgi:hypothetical protein